MKKRILIDMDAIVADLATDWYRMYNEQYPGTPVIDIENIRQWNIARAIGDGRIYEVLKTPGLYRNLKVFPGAQHAIQRLQKYYNVTFLTAAITAPHILAEKSEWLREHFPFVDPKDHAYVYRKELVAGDFFIDDSPKNLKKWAASNPNGVTITIDYPYNRDTVVDLRADGHKNMAQAWEEISDTLVEALEV